MFRENNEGPLTLVYRRKGEKVELAFSGSIFVLGEDGHTLVHVPRSELGGVQRIDLCHCPVVSIGGKKKWQAGRVQDFLASNKGFEGAFLLLPGSGNWDLDSGDLLLTKREVMDPSRRISGGRPESQWTNHRWERDGRYLADRARMLHGKVLEVLQPAVEQEPGAAAVGEKLTGLFCPFEHRLADQCREICEDLSALENRRVLLSDETAREIPALIRERLTEKLSAVGVRFVRDIPADMTITAEEIAPELVRDRETLGTVEIPGLGRRSPERVRTFLRQTVFAVWLAVEEVARIKAWPLPTCRPVLHEVDSQAYNQLKDASSFDDVAKPELTAEERWHLHKEELAKRLLTRQRVTKHPKAESVADPRQSDPPPTPAPVVWGTDLRTGERITAYAALVHNIGACKGRISDRGWEIRWYDDADEAAEADRKARVEATSYVEARRLEAELTARAGAVEFPVALPTYTPPTFGYREILSLAGVAECQYRVREDVGHWYSEGWEGYRSRTDYEWVDGKPSTAQLTQLEDGVWVIGQTGLTHLFEGVSVGTYRREAFALPVLQEMGVAKENIQATLNHMAGERSKTEANFRAQVRKFVEAIRRSPVFACLPSGLQAKVVELVDVNIDWRLPDPAAVEAELRSEWGKASTLLQAQEQGEVLTNWGGHFREMGATGQAQYWVIRPDGAERAADEVGYRKAYTSEGNKTWRLVGPAELAIFWSKAYTAADHEFVIAKTPVGGCTPEQLATVSRIEREIDERFEGAVGLSGRMSPGAGRGWNFGGSRPAPKTTASVRKDETSVASTPTTPPAPVVDATPVDLSKVSLGGLFGGRAKSSSKDGRRK